MVALLVITRISVPFQFQSVSPFFPQLEARLGITHSGLGLLLGLYMAPGIIVALSLPHLLAEAGRTRVIAVALCAMATGELLFGATHDFSIACLARLVAGCGGCVIYILTINMVADLENAGSRAARMGFIAASWPFGNAMALLLLGTALSLGLDGSSVAPLAIIALAAACVAALLLADRSRGRLIALRPGPSASLAAWRLVLSRIRTVAVAFSLYNIAFIVMTGFAPSLLRSWGASLQTSTSIASIPMWMFLVSVPLGGILARRSDRGATLQIGVGCIGATIAFLASASSAHPTLLYGIAGLLGGLPTAPLLARVGTLSGSSADITYSAMFLVFFVLLLAIPPLVGFAVDTTGSVGFVPFFVSTCLVVAFALFAWSARREQVA